MRFSFIKDAPMLYSFPVTGITGMDTPGITNCTVNNSGFYVCNNSVEDMQYPSYSTGNGSDVVWEGLFPPKPLAFHQPSSPAPHLPPQVSRLIGVLPQRTHATAPIEGTDRCAGSGHQ